MWAEVRERRHLFGLAAFSGGRAAVPTFLALYAATILLILSPNAAVSAQAVFGTGVLSVSVIDSCTSLPASQTDRPVFQPGTSVPIADSSPCSILGGEDQPFTEVILSVSADQVLGGETLTFQLSGPASGEVPPDGTDCYGTLQGADCQVFSQPLLISLESGLPVEVFDLYPRPEIPFASFWESTQPIPTDEFQCNGCPPQSSRGETFTVPLTDVQSVFDPSGNSWPFSTATAPSNVGKTGIISVCPNPMSSRVRADGVDTQAGFTSGEMAYFPQFPNSADGGNTQTEYEALEQASSIPVLFAPLLVGTDGDVSAWKAGFTRQVGPTCTPNSIGPEPSLLFNIKVGISLGTPSNGTGSATSGNPTEFISLSTAQDGLMATDATGRILASLFNTAVVGSQNGQPLSGTIITCGACAVGDSLSSAHCAHNTLSDFFQCANEDTSECDDIFDVAYTQNIYLSTPGGRAALRQGCTVPTQLCRRILGGDGRSANNDVLGFWYFMDQQKSALSLGGGFGRIDQSPAFYAEDATTAELMASSGLSGSGVAGYQVTDIPQGARFTPATPCQTMLQISIDLDSRNNQGESVSFAYAMPADDNGSIPLYAIDGRRLIRQIPGSTSITARVSLAVPASYTGAVVSFAGGEIVAKTMICSVPDDSSAGEIAITVRNTGATAGGYTASALFGSEVVTGTGRVSDTLNGGDGAGDPEDTTTFAVSSSTPCSLELEPNTSGQCVIAFSYTGPVDQDLVATVTLFSSAVIAGRGPAVLGVTTVGCEITAPIDESGPFGSQTFGQTLGDRQYVDDGDGDSDDGPAFDLSLFQIFVLVFVVVIDLSLMGVLVYYLVKFCIYQRELTKNQGAVLRAGGYTT